jgi:sortase B
MKKKKRLWLILTLGFLVIAMGSGGFYVAQQLAQKERTEEYQVLSESVNKVEEENATSEDDDARNARLKELGIEIPEKNLDWEELAQTNEDIYAWIYVPNTEIDYPIVQHPSDDAFYLDHNLDGSAGLPGTIYTEPSYTSKEFDDLHTVVYGHNIAYGSSGGTMFSTLYNFASEEVFQQENYIYIYTPDDVFVYQIFAAYEYESLHLMYCFDYTNEYVYEDFLRSIYETNGRVANVKQEIEVTVEDQILTLSTCTQDSRDDLRMLVTGVLLNPKQTDTKK